MPMILMLLPNNQVMINAGCGKVILPYKIGNGPIYQGRNVSG